MHSNVIFFHVSEHLALERNVELNFDEKISNDGITIDRILDAVAELESYILGKSIFIYFCF